MSFQPMDIEPINATQQSLVRIFSDEYGYNWTHCLGNLVLLTRAKNSQASNWDFERKKVEYFSSKAGISSFKLTTMVLKEKRWDLATLSRRHNELLKKLASIWRLDFDAWVRHNENSRV